MIPDQCLLGLSDRLLDRVKLLGDVEAAAAALDHLDDAAQMAVGPLEALDDFGMGLMLMWLFHPIILSPRGGYRQPVATPLL